MASDAAVLPQVPATTLEAAATNQDNTVRARGANRKVEELRDINMKRTTSLTDVEGLRCLHQMDKFTHSLERDGEKEGADVLTDLVDVAVGAIRRHLKELERYSNPGGGYSFEGIRLLNRAIATFVVYDTR